MIGSFIKRKLGYISVKSDDRYISIEGVSKPTLMLDINKFWGTTSIAKYTLANSNLSTIKVSNFFAIDLLYILTTLYNEGRTRTPKRILEKMINELKENTWLGNVDKIETTSIDVNAMNQYAIFKPKDYQVQFAKYYIAVTSAFKLKGYMLDSEPGTGKTLSMLFLANYLNPQGVKIWIVPKKAVKEVWEDTIEHKVVGNETHWSTLSGKPLTTGYMHYIVHYEELKTILNFVKQNKAYFKNSFVGLDESHNFTRLEAERTQLFLDLCALPEIDDNVWASGTPISALGSECIPFLKCIDPYFDKEAEDAFRKIYTKSAKKANDILRHRIGHLKFFVPAQTAGNVVPTIIPTKVTMPEAGKFTLDSIANELRKYMDERTKYYAANHAMYEKQYTDGLVEFMKSSAYRNDVKSFELYRKYIKVISSGYDPKLHKEEAMYCNRYELKTIIPTLSSDVGKKFKSARSVVKYVHLKVLGEALGLLSKYRSACFKAMIPYSNLPDLIDSAKKKTIIFTSYVDVVEELGKFLEHEGYQPILIYGETNKKLSPLVKQFYTDPDANPLIATFQSLSEAVPLIAANRIINMNQPFRDRVKTQAIARAARMGQDHEVDVFDLLLDTGDKENISTRNQDILEWSADMVKSIMGKENIDLDTVEMEALIPDEYLDRGEYTTESTLDETPTLLYHGSKFKQDELKPGFQHTGVEVKWDKTESNRFLYATSDYDEAVMLGIGSALEKDFDTSRYSYDEKQCTLKVIAGDKPITKDDLYKLDVYVYRIKGSSDDGWIFNYNINNGITTEWKTENTIDDNIIRCEKIDVGYYLQHWNIAIKESK